MKQYCVNCIYESIPHDVMSLPAQHILFHEFDEMDYVYRIIEGMVIIHRLHRSGDEKVFDVLGERDYVALLAVLQNKDRYVATATTLTPVQLIRMKVADVKTAYRSNEIFKDVCLNCAVTRSNLFQQHLFQTINIDTEEKILSTLQLLAKRFGTVDGDRIILDLPFSKTVLASIIGIRRETLSRRLTNMQQQKIIEIHRNQYIFRRM